MTHRSPLALLALAFALLFAPDARADLFVTVIADESGAPASADGGGSLTSIAEAAATYWEGAFAGNDTDVFLTVSVLWTTLGSGVIAAAGPHSYDGVDTYTSFIGFQDTGAVDFWFDPTPFEHGEFGALDETTADLGGGSMVVGREYDTLGGDFGSGEIDALTVMLHEMAHTIGFTTSVGGYASEIGDGDIDVDTAGMPFEGAALPASGSHFTSALSTSLMSTSLGPGVRKLPSDADILAIAEINGFDPDDITFTPVPEPAGGALGGALLGLIALVGRGRGRARTRRQRARRPRTS